MPICIISDKKYEIQIIKLCKKYSYVYKFQGSALNVYHLQNAGIMNAFHVVLLNQQNEMSVTADSNTIMTANLIKEIAPHVRMTIDFIDPKMSILLESGIFKNKITEIDAIYSPSYM